MIWSTGVCVYYPFTVCVLIPTSQSSNGTEHVPTHNPLDTKQGSTQTFHKTQTHTYTHAYLFLFLKSYLFFSYLFSSFALNCLLFISFQQQNLTRHDNRIPTLNPPRLSKMLRDMNHVGIATAEPGMHQSVGLKWK